MDIRYIRRKCISTCDKPQADLDGQDIIKRVEAFLLERQSYLNTNLSLTSLARQMVIVPNHLSRAINGQTNNNFSEYINSYRIKHACDLLASASSANLSVMDVMLESGFTTKSNFNRAFKSATGMSPMAYKKQCLSEKKD